GLVRKLEFGPTAARYEIQRSDNHHHVHCRSCGRIEDVPCQHGSAPCMTPAQTHGMVIDVADVDRKSTRLNSSHVSISYAVFCLNYTPPPTSYPLSLPDALPIWTGQET